MGLYNVCNLKIYIKICCTFMLSGWKQENFCVIMNLQLPHLQAQIFKIKIKYFALCDFLYVSTFGY
jgi:hypothetical protein